MNENTRKPLVAGGPEPTETVADWHAILRSARSMNSPLQSELEKLEFDEAFIGDTGKTRALHLRLRGIGDAAPGVTGLLWDAARPVFGDIFLGWSSD